MDGIIVFSTAGGWMSIVYIMYMHARACGEMRRWL